MGESLGPPDPNQRSGADALHFTDRIADPVGGPALTEQTTDGVTILQLLRRLERCRKLNVEEQRLKVALEATVDAKRLRWYWSPTELREIDRFISRRARVGRPRPFECNNEVRDLAARLGRSYMATHRMIERRRKQRKAERECSNARQAGRR